MIRFNTCWRLSVRVDEQYVLIQFARRRRDPNVGGSS